MESKKEDDQRVFIQGKHAHVVSKHLYESRLSASQKILSESIARKNKRRRVRKLFVKKVLTPFNSISKKIRKFTTK